MKVHFYGPFRQAAEDECELELSGPTTVRELLAVLAGRYPGLARYAAPRDNAQLLAHMSILCDGEPLKLDDEVRDDQEVHLLMPASGG